MKKTVVGLAALASTGITFAQSSVTLFGVMDTAVVWSSNKSEDLRPITRTNPVNLGSATVSRTDMQTGRLIPSRLGFRGTEDLGGGLAASFWLESAVGSDDGTVVGTFWSRRSTVSLSGIVGEVRLGRDYTPTFWNDSAFDPFGALGSGAALPYTANTANPLGGAGGFGGNLNVVRTSNTVGYFLPPNLGGIYGQFMYGLNERTAVDPGILAPTTLNTQSAGRYLGGRIGYQSGAFNTAIAFSDVTTADNFLAGTTDYVKQVNLGATYDFNIVKLFAGYNTVKSNRKYLLFTASPRPDADMNGWVIGVNVPVGSFMLRASYSTITYEFNNGQPNPEAQKVALGFIYNLSKRTAIYSTYAWVDNKNKAAVTANGPAFISNAIYTPKTSNVLETGIRFVF